MFPFSFTGFRGSVVDYATSTAGGSTALEVALRSMGIGPGDEVITPALTRVATQLAAVMVGADPVFVDVTPDTYCTDTAAPRSETRKTWMIS